MRLREFLVRRAIYTIITILIVLVLMFVLFRLMPGDPTTLIIDPRMKPEHKAILLQRWGLDRPIWEQFGRYMVGTLTGDFGISFYHYPRTAWEVIATRIPPTLLLFGTATILSWPIGIGLGTLLAWRRGTKMELSTIVVTLFFYSMPLFWFGLIILWLFAYMLNLFPLGGIVAGEMGYTGWAYVLDLLHHLTLPLITLMILGLAGGVLLMRNSIMEVLGEDYITTAKAKGLPEKTVMYKHAARTAMLPVVTSIAISMGHIISGGVLTETIFSWPGIGRLLFESTLQMDYPVVQAAFFILAIMTILANVAADILYAYLDPRVRL